MRTLSTIMIVCLLSFLFAGTTYTQWVQTYGPYRPNDGVYSWLTVPDGTGGTTIFAGTYGVFRSTNDGARWTPVNNGLTPDCNQAILALASSPTGSGGTNIFAGSYCGVFLSTNNGASWAAVNSGLTHKEVRALAVIDTTLFAGIGYCGTWCDNGGVFRSTNNGTSWTLTGLSYTFVQSFAVRDTILFAGTYGGGVFRSTNNGDDWIPVNLGLGNPYVFSMAVVGTNIFAGTGADVFRSTDDGAHWIYAGANNNGEVSDLTPNGPNLFAAYYGRGIYLTTNQGVSWTQINNGLTDTTPFTCIAIYLNGTGGTNIIAGTGYGDAFLSTDYGQHWNATSGFNYAGISDLVVASDGFGVTIPYAATDGIVGINGGGVFRSTNNGTNWTAVNAGLSPWTEIRALAVNGPNVFATGNAGTPAGYTGGSVILRMANNGASWATVDSSDSSFSVYTLLSKGSNLFIGADTGIFLSTDDGAHWTAVNNGLPRGWGWRGGPYTVGVGTMEVSGENLFATNFQIMGSFPGIYRSTNNGSLWTALDTTLYVQSFAVNGPNLFAGTYDRLYRSSDNGNSWTSTTTGLNDSSVICFALSGTNVFAGTAHGIFLSIDNGDTWKAVSEGLTDSSISHLAVSTSDIFATTGSGIWRRPISEMITMPTIEIASGWNMLSVPMTVSDYRKISVYPSAVSNAFAYQGGYVQEDTLSNGVGYWLKFSTTGSLEVNGSYLTAETIAVSPGWNMVGSISTPVPVQSITCDSSTIITSNFFGYKRGYFVSDTIYPGKGYWVKVNQAGKLILNSGVSTQLSLNRISIVPTSELPPAPPEGEVATQKTGIPKEFAIEQNYPNPFNPTTVIRYSLPVNSVVTLKVYNVLGQEVATLVNGVEEPGYKSVNFNASSLTSGIYFYRLKAGNYIETKKFLLLK